jgi:hypothetical protein
MAGFDFTVACTDSEEPFQRVLLRAIQRTGRELGLAVRYRREPGGFYCSVDGPLPLMHALDAYVQSDLPVLVDALRTPAERRRRARVAARLYEAFRERLEDMTESIQELASMYEGIPRSVVFDPGAKTHLKASLHDLTRTLVGYMTNRVAAQTAVEDMHTGLEHVLATYFGRRGCELSFVGMVDLAEADGALADEEGEAARRLNRIRTDAKHRGQAFDEEEAAKLIWACVPGLHGMLSAMTRDS